MPRFLSLVVLFPFLLGAEMAAGQGGSGLHVTLASPGSSLVRVAVGGKADLKLFRSTGLPAFSLQSRYLLTGADAEGMRSLERTGLSVTVLDGDMQGATYYLAFPMPGAAPGEWSLYGRFLLEEDGAVLLRMDAADAERLSAQGVGLQAITLDPSPPIPASPPPWIPTRGSPPCSPRSPAVPSTATPAV